MKYLAIALACLTLTACIEDGSDITDYDRTITVCLDGVEYWMVSADTQGQALAPRVDPETLTFVRCTEKEK